jgi:hypothetical protein
MFDGLQTLTYNVDEQIVGSTSASVYWLSAPACGSNGSITITKDLNTAKNKSYTYTVKDNLGFTYWAGILNFEADACEAKELVY